MSERPFYSVFIRLNASSPSDLRVFLFKIRQLLVDDLRCDVSAVTLNPLTARIGHDSALTILENWHHLQIFCQIEELDIQHLQKWLANYNNIAHYEIDDTFTIDPVFHSFRAITPTHH